MWRAGTLSAYTPRCTHALLSANASTIAAAVEELDEQPRPVPPDGLGHPAQRSLRAREVGRERLGGQQPAGMDGGGLEDDHAGAAAGAGLVVGDEVVRRQVLRDEVRLVGGRGDPVGQRDGPDVERREEMPEGARHASGRAAPVEDAGELAHTAARDESGGLIEAVSDDEILEAYALLARSEGIFVEPASAACVAGLLKAGRAGDIRGGRAVAILTGNGLKDPETAAREHPSDVVSASPTVVDIAKALGW